ncbi:MAG: hypothetical protein ABUT20_34480 [Bacteroidota bacterium]
MIKTIDLKEYRKVCINFILVISIMIAASFLLVRLHLYLHWTNANSDIFKNILLLVMVGAAFIHTNNIRKKKETLLALPGSEEKIAYHKKYFTLRMWWHIITCAISCILYIIADHTFFFFFAVLELIMVIEAFPTKLSFARELNDDSINFI